MSDRADEAVTWNYPTHMCFGAGSIRNLPLLCRYLDITRPLIVTDQGLKAASFIQEICEIAQSTSQSTELYTHVKSNPVGQNVDDGVAVLKSGRHDGIIAVGGGSALDVGKTMSLMARQSSPLWEVGGEDDDWTGIDGSQIAPLIAIPTTAGTGSEVSRAAVITDERRRIKKIIFHPAMLPPAVILDPELTYGLPCELTAATGMDAFVHCFEAYCAPGYHPMADGIALEGMHLVARSLHHAYTHGNDAQARGDMLTAAAMGATAFQKGLGGVHALAHGVGALCDTHHGLTNAVLLPYVMIANREVIEGRMRRVAQALAISNLTFQGVLEWALTQRRVLGIPHTLEKIGVPADRLYDIGVLAKADPCDAANPVTLTSGDYVRIAENAFEGKL